MPRNSPLITPVMMATRASHRAITYEHLCCFLWFVDFAPPLILSPETVVFAVGDFEELTQQSLETGQPMLIWHEGAYALRDELYEQIEEPWYNNILWKTEEMGQLLSNGHTIWREGFTPEAIQPCAPDNATYKIDRLRRLFNSSTSHCNLPLVLHQRPMVLVRRCFAEAPTNRPFPIYSKPMPCSLNTKRRWQTHRCTTSHIAWIF